MAVLRQMISELPYIFIFALICYLTLEVLTEIIDCIYSERKGGRKP